MAGKDWEAIEREYRAGQLSVSEIGRQHGVSHTAINKRAAKEGWSRDLTKRVRREISSRLVSEEVSETNAREAIETAAERGVAVVLGHRQDIARLRKLAVFLTGRLDDQLSSAELTAAQILGGADVLERLTRTISRLVPLERQAFNLGTDAPPGDDDNDLTIRFVTA